MEKLIPVILECKAKSIEKANKIAESYQNCPYVTFMAAVENQVYINILLASKATMVDRVYREQTTGHIRTGKGQANLPPKIVLSSKDENALIEKESKHLTVQLRLLKMPCLHSMFRLSFNNLL